MSRRRGTPLALVCLSLWPALAPAQGLLTGGTSQQLPIFLSVAQDGAVDLFQLEYACGGGTTRAAFRFSSPCIPDAAGAFSCGAVEACGDAPSFLFEGTITGPLAAGIARIRTSANPLTRQCCETSFSWSVVSESERVFASGFETLSP